MKRPRNKLAGFTLIELLTVVAILAVMVTVGIGTIGSGKRAARIKGATRDIFAAIRHARSVALVSGQPAIVTYATETIDDEVVAKVEVTSAKLIDSGVDRSKVTTLSGEPLEGEGAAGYELVHIEKSKAKPVSQQVKGKDAAATASTDEGDTMSEVLFAPMNTDIVKGMRLKVLKDGEELASDAAAKPRKSGISVFSNVDYLLGRFNESKTRAKSEKAEDESSGKKTDEAEQEPVSVVWESNGRVEPHRVWVYPDGKRPEDGLVIKIDRFGGAKVLAGDGRDDEE